MTVVTALIPAAMQAGANDAGAGNDTSIQNTSQSRETEPSTKQAAPRSQSVTRQQDRVAIRDWWPCGTLSALSVAFRPSIPPLGSGHG